MSEVTIVLSFASDEHAVGVLPGHMKRSSVQIMRTLGSNVQTEVIATEPAGTNLPYVKVFNSHRECSCYRGFDGLACQRSVCPNECNGRGQCLPMKVSFFTIPDR